jgi:hypothetical protein
VRTWLGLTVLRVEQAATYPVEIERERVVIVLT